MGKLIDADEVVRKLEDAAYNGCIKIEKAIAIVRESLTKVVTCPVSPDALYKNIVDFLIRYDARIPERNTPGSLDMISDFLLCAGLESAPSVGDVDDKSVVNIPGDGSGTGAATALPIRGEVDDRDKRIKILVGGLRSIAYGDAQTWPNCSSREVAKQALRDGGGEKRPGLTSPTSTEVSSEAIVQARGNEVLVDHCRELEEENARHRESIRCMSQVFDDLAEELGVDDAKKAGDVDLLFEAITRQREALRGLLTRCEKLLLKQSSSFCFADCPEWVAARQALGVQPLKEAE